MPTVQELYELWAGDSELRDALGRSLDPRGTEWLFQHGENHASPARLLRGDFAEHYGDAAVASARGGLLWGIYQLLGKLCPTVYVWTSST